MVALSVAFVLDFSCSTPLRHAGRGSAVEERVFEIKSQLMSAKYKWKLLTRPNTHTVTASHTHKRTHSQERGSLSMKQRKINKPNDVKRQLAGRTRTNIHTYIHNFVQFVCVCVRGMQTRSVALASAPLQRQKGKAQNGKNYNSRWRRRPTQNVNACNKSE